jgi:hypothetical protein
VESLHFWKIMSESLHLPPAPLLCSALFSLCPTPPPPSPAMCRALTAPRGPSGHHVLLLHPAATHPTALASPRLATPRYRLPELLSAATHHRCSPTGATSCFWESPRVAPRSTAALVLPAVFSRTRHAAPATVRAPPATATLAAGRQHQLSLTVPSL